MFVKTLLWQDSGRGTGTFTIVGGNAKLYNPGNIYQNYINVYALGTSNPTSESI